MQTLAINSFSKELQEIIDKARPKAGVVTFRLLAAPTPIDIEDSDKRRITMDRLPQRTRLKRKERIIDPGTSREVTLACVRGYEEGAGVGQTDKAIIEEVIFLGANNGQLDVPVDDAVLFERLLLSNYNRDSPNPRKVEPDAGYLYGLVQPEKDAKTRLDARLAIARALNAIDKLGDKAVLRAAEKLDLPTVDRGRTLEVDELKMSLVQVAETEPLRVESVLEAGEKKLDDLVEKAVKYGIIDFVTDVQQWRYKATQEPICEALHGFKPEEALVAYMQKNANGPKFSQILVARIAQEEKRK